MWLMTCDMCEAAPHPNCDVYAQLEVMNPTTGVEKTLSVCLGHYEAFVRADNTEDSDE
jgi:hypothetical protein